MSRLAKQSFLALVAAAASLASQEAKAREGIWWEAEKPRKHSFGTGSWLSGKRLEKRDVLSGGEWLNFSGRLPRRPVRAEYEIHVASRKTYALWTRKFWKHGPFRWRFDGSKTWRNCGRDCGLHDSTPIQKNVCANWVSLGSVELARGKHVFEIELVGAPGTRTTACFDAFLLTTKPFTARGKLKPWEKSGRALPGFFAFEPDADGFEESVIDLRYLNERQAGQDGPVRAKGNGFVLGNGRPVRFWGVNLGPGILDLGRAAVATLARSLAKRGVNLVRFHGPIFDARARDPRTIDRQRLDKLHQLSARLKEQGIYLHLSFYFPLWFRIKDSYGIKGYEKGARTPFALLFFDKRMQEIYRAWARALLGTKNPYTGLCFAKDPGILMVEIQNEDSLLFWTFSKKSIPRRVWQQMNEEFSKWRGSDSELEDAWHMTKDGRRHGDEKLIQDQVRFLAEKQRAFYTKTIAFFRKELGVLALVSCSNWHTADPGLLDGIERWTYAAGDVMDQHMYFGGKHQGEGASYSVRVGHTFADRSALREPLAMPLRICQVEGYPHIVSEIGWPNPNRFKAEFCLLAAVYASLQGLDGLELFALHTTGWETSLSKFPLQVPSIMGQFPALALAYRRGDIAQGKTVALERSTIDKLIARGEQICGSTSLDQLRQKDLPASERRASPKSSAFSPEAFFVGRVARAFTHTSSSTRFAKLPGIDPKKQRIESSTGEITWDYGKGVLSVESPRFVALGGFLGKAGPLRLGDFEISCENEYAAISIIALDALPLRNSKKILVQCMTEEKPFGWQSRQGRITKLGQYPMQVRNIAVKIARKKGRALRRASALDVNGYAREKIPLARGTLQVPKDAIYCIIE